MSSPLSIWQTASPFQPVLPVTIYPLIAYFCVTIGLAATGVFVVQGSRTHVAKQLQTALAASVLLAFGAVLTSVSIGLPV
ncbi:hypothetical protein BC940DRAFT_312898 [Gongronella butleri]|nr:hypothetical protein BC940DRAFT_312898 [Gongronella butleri]